ncbi:C-C motif chemokine 25 [Scomber japonicus]|uniref:C-C motif chemokine 25 n=1 Tax=Scomber japonicus TaxID=13676 RepID=UPI002305F35E|nr:C-C motif chemokine 25 [Scomber japonicus]
MRFNALCFLVILCSIYLALAQVSYDDCCLKYVKKLRDKTLKHVMKYRRQETDGGCNINAVILTMRRGRVLCANPKDQWVSELMERIDKKKDRNPVGKRN